MISIRKLRKNKQIYKNAILKRGDEFDFEKGELLGKGGFGEVRKCNSK